MVRVCSTLTTTSLAKNEVGRPEQSRGQLIFVRDFLERCGFHNVRVIAETPAYHREVERLLFAAEPIGKVRAEVVRKTLKAV